MEKILVPGDIQYVIEQLNKNGFEAYLVGGCVRDSLLGRAPNDWDVTTSALPEQIKQVFPRSFDIGIKHGTVSVLIAQSIVEVTTFRIDGDYLDNRRPESVTFTTSLKEDCSRRDFTINALAYHPQKGVIDYFNGLEDIKNKKIRAVGDAAKRFQEDALRILRAVRFSAQLNFDIEKATYTQIAEQAHLITKISTERIREELTKLLISDNADKFSLLYTTGLLKYIMPEMESSFDTKQNHPYHVYTVAEHSLEALKNVEPNVILRWTLLLHDCGKPATKTTDAKGIDHFYGHQKVSAQLASNIMNRLRFDNKTIAAVNRLITYHDIDIDESEKSVRRAINKVGVEYFEDLIKVQKADKSAQNPRFFEDSMSKILAVEQIYKSILNNKHPLSVADLAVNGNDLIAMGLKPGREFNELFKYLLDCVLDNPALNEREALLDLVQKRVSETK